MTAGRFIHANGIRIVHAHSTSIFVSRLAALLARDSKVIWHVHFGAQSQQRRTWPYSLLTAGIAGVIAVSDDLKDWSRKMRPSDTVWYIPNSCCCRRRTRFQECVERVYAPATVMTQICDIYDRVLAA